jgi:hypothetical protein
VTATVRPDSRGAVALNQLGSDLGEGTLATMLAGFDPKGTTDRSWRAFQQATGGSVDLSKAAHRRTVAGLLRSWGCRHLRVADDAMTTQALAAWWRTAEALLPSGRRQLVELDASSLRDAGRAFDSLATRAAARHVRRERTITVTFGNTAASKALCMVRPNAFPPWDAAITLAFGWRAPTGAEYVEYLRGVAQALRDLSGRLAVPVADLPAVLGRPSSSSARIADEFLWLRLTRGGYR